MREDVDAEVTLELDVKVIELDVEVTLDRLSLLPQD